MTGLATPANAKLKKSLIIKTATRRSLFSEETSLASAIAAPTLRNDLSPKLKFERRPLTSIKPAKRRIRKASPSQIERVARCICRVGVCAPILIDADGHIIDGHSVFEAAKRLGIERLPCTIVEHLEPAEVEYLKIALNRISELGDWDVEELKPVLVELHAAGFVLEDTGFTVPELDAIIIGESTGSQEAEEQDAQPSACPVSRDGDLWRAEGHRILCGDATRPASFDLALNRLKAHAIFTDPPWNIPIKGFVSQRHDDFKMGAGEMSHQQFLEFVDRFTRLCCESLEDGGVMFECIDWRSFDLIVSRAREAGLQLVNTAVWNKGSGGMGGLYRSAHELIPVLCKGKTPRVNNVKLGRHGRDRTNVWSYPGANRRGSSAGEVLKDHPTPKPVEMVHDAIIDVTKLGEIILDPFLGSGTTLIAAQRAGRICCGIELDPGYVDLSIARWQAATGKQALHDETGLTFDELANLRGEVGNCDERGGSAER